MQMWRKIHKKFKTNEKIAMKTLALCMIVKNEEAVLERCLQCVKHIVDEIIIVDTGSTDRTVEIAHKYTSKVYHFTWQNNFAKARNFSFSKASADYILWLDADDILLPSAQNKLIALKKSLTGAVDCYFLKYDMQAMQAEENAFCFFRERIVKNNQNFYWQGAAHEFLVVYGNIVQVDIAITHQKSDLQKRQNHRNLLCYCHHFAKEGFATAREIYYCARELLDNRQYALAISLLEYFLHQKEGWKEDKLCACLLLSNAYLATKQTKKALNALYKSFAYSSFRPEICCAIGNIFVQTLHYPQAIFWYNLAILSAEEGKKSVFYCKAYATFIPYMQLCLCYDRLGNLQKAYQYHKLAGKYNKNHKDYLYNQAYFEKILNCKGEN